MPTQPLADSLRQLADNTSCTGLSEHHDKHVLLSNSITYCFAQELGMARQCGLGELRR